MTCLFLLFVASFLYAHYLIIAPAEGQQIRRERPSNHLRQALCLLRVMNYQRHLCLSRLGCQFYMTSCCILMIVYRYDSLLCSFSKCTPFLCSQSLESATATKGKGAKSESAGSER